MTPTSFTCVWLRPASHRTTINIFGTYWGYLGAILQQLEDNLGIFPRGDFAAALICIVDTPTREGTTSRRLETSSWRGDKTWTTPKVPLLSRYVDSMAMYRTAVPSVPAAERGKPHEMLARTSCSGGGTTTWRAS